MSVANWIAPIRIKPEHSPAFRTASSLPGGVGIIVLLLRPGPSLGQNILYYYSNKSRMHQFQIVSGFRSAMMASNGIHRVFLDLGRARAVIFREIRADSYLGLYIVHIRERGTETGLTVPVCLCVSLNKY